MSSLSQFFGGGKLPLGVKSTAFYIDVLIVGGGGGPSTFVYGQIGSGGGRVLQAFNLLVEKNISYTVTVGGAGAALQNGQDSIFGSLIAQGGGTANNTGGSGGGGGAGGVVGAPPVFPSIGTYTINDVLNATNIISSGNSGGGTSSNLGAGGGGGAGSAGLSYAGTITTGGRGGDGLISTIKGSGPYFYGAGTGGTSIYNTTGTNSGAGAGGANTGTGGQSGVVVIAYPNRFSLATTTGSPILYSAFPPPPLAANATRTGYHVYEFRGSGTITFN